MYGTMSLKKWTYELLNISNETLRYLHEDGVSIPQINKFNQKLVQSATARCTWFFIILPHNF